MTEIRKIEKEEIVATILFGRNGAYSLLNTGPNIATHALLNISACVTGLCQVMAQLMAPSTAEGEGINTNTESIIPAEINQDMVALALLLTLESIQITNDNQELIVKMKPDVISSAIDSFKKLYGRNPEGLSPYIWEMSKEDTQDTQDTLQTQNWTLQ